MTGTCCPTDSPALMGLKYDPSGVKSQVILPDSEEPMMLYTVGSGPKCIVLVYDIFGIHPNNFQLMDRLSAELGSEYTCCFADFFRGQPWPATKWPLNKETQPEFMQWLGDKADKPKNGSKLNSLLDHLKSQGKTSFGVIGMCWGGKLAITVTSREDVKCGASAHPSFFEPEDGKTLTKPFVIFPAREDDVTKFLEGVKENPTPSLLSVHEMRDVTHGYMSARGNWEDETDGKRARETIDIMKGLFSKYM